MQTPTWTARISVVEDADVTTAHAALTDGDEMVALVAAEARRNPQDAPVPEIGQELAVARALYALADRLMDAAARDVENLSHPVSSAPSSVTSEERS